jgi:hypothetical protein
MRLQILPGVMMKPIILSYGGGRQTVALCVLVLMGKLPRPERIIMADTGREASETWDYLYNHVEPMLQRGGLTVEIASHELSKVDLYAKNGDLLIPAYTEHGKLPTFCSNEWKARVVARYLRSHGYGEKNPVVTWIGISRDEAGRIKPSGVAWNTYHYPLALDLRMTVHDCEVAIARYGLPPAPKSSCWMCPHRRNAQWRRLRDHAPQDFIKAIMLDDQVYRSHGVRLHESGKPLGVADLTDDPPIQPSLFGDVDGCDSGLCWS